MDDDLIYYIDDGLKNIMLSVSGLIHLAECLMPDETECARDSKVVHIKVKSEDRDMPVSRKIPVNVDHKPEKASEPQAARQDDTTSGKPPKDASEPQSAQQGDTQNAEQNVPCTAGAPKNDAASDNAAANEGSSAEKGQSCTTPEPKSEMAEEVSTKDECQAEPPADAPSQDEDNGTPQAPEEPVVSELPKGEPPSEPQSEPSAQTEQCMDDAKRRMMREMFERFTELFFQTYERYFDRLFNEVSGKAMLTTESPAFTDIAERLKKMEERIEAIGKSVDESSEASKNADGNARTAIDTARAAKQVADDAKRDAAAALRDAENAKTKAGEASSTANGAKQVVEQANNTANTANQYANYAANLANQAQSAAEAAEKAADKAAEAADKAASDGKKASDDAAKALKQGQEILTIINAEKRENEDLIRQWLAGYQNLQNQLFEILRNGRKPLSKDEKHSLDVSVCNFIKDCLLGQYGQSTASDIRIVAANDAVKSVLDEIQKAIIGFIDKNDAEKKVFQAFRSYLKKNLADCLIIPQNGDAYDSELHEPIGSVVPSEGDDDYQIEFTVLPGINNPQNASATVKAPVRLKKTEEPDETSDNSSMTATKPSAND